MAADLLVHVLWKRFVLPLTDSLVCWFYKSTTKDKAKEVPLKDNKAHTKSGQILCAFIGCFQLEPYWHS